MFGPENESAGSVILPAPPRPILGRWLVVFGFVLAWLVTFVGTAYARDCPPDDPSRSDCLAAATTARNPLVPLTGGVAGGVAGELIGRRVGKGRKPAAGVDEAGDDEEDEEEEDEEEQEEEEDEEDENPCQQVFTDFQTAKLNQSLLLDSFVSWQSTIQSLDELYWKTSKAGYYGGVVDVGFLAGSVFGRPLAGLSEALGKKYLGDNLKQKLLETMLKSMLKGSLKDASKYFDPAKMPGKLGKDLSKKALQEWLKEQITTSVMQEKLGEGAIRAGGFDGATVKFMENVKNYDKFRSIITKTYADHWANFLGDTMSLYSAGSDALSTKEQLELIRGRLRAAEEGRAKTQSQLDAAAEEVSRLRDANNACSQSDAYQRYLRLLEFRKLRSQG